MLLLLYSLPALTTTCLGSCKPSANCREHIVKGARRRVRSRDQRPSPPVAPLPLSFARVCRALAESVFGHSSMGVSVDSQRCMWMSRIVASNAMERDLDSQSLPCGTGAAIGPCCLTPTPKTHVLAASIWSPLACCLVCFAVVLCCVVWLCGVAAAVHSVIVTMLDASIARYGENILHLCMEYTRCREPPSRPAGTMRLRLVVSCGHRPAAHDLIVHVSSLFLWWLLLQRSSRPVFATP